MRIRLVVWSLIVVMASVPGCSRKPAEDKAAQPAAAASSPAAAPGTAGAVVPPAKPVPAELPEILAQVNGEPLKRDELQLAIRNLEGRAGSPVPPDQRDSVYRQVLDRLIGYRLLVQETRARKVTAPPWEVDKRLSEIKQQFPNEQAFNEMMLQRGMSLDRLRQETGETIAVNQMLEKEFASVIAAPDADVRKFFDENKPRFHQEETVRASHILIRVEEGADAATRAKARAQVEDIQKQVKKGADFAELAKKHSQDPGSAPAGGDLGFFARGQMVPQFSEAAFATKPGTVTGVVETPFGYHLIRVAENKPAQDRTFDEVKEQIREYLMQQLREQKSLSFIEQLRSKGKVEVLI